MKLVSYELQGVSKVGELRDGEIFEILNCNTMLELIEEDQDWRYSETSVSLDAVELLSPIPRPIRNVLCLGKNYRDHAIEMKDKISEEVFIPEFPIYFTKMAHEIIGTGMTVESYSPQLQTMDYEVELAVIIGKKGRDIPAREAKNHIFGYAVGNDLCMRELQKDHFQWFKGKSLDTHTAIGPVIVTADAIEYPPALGIRAYVNDELRQDSNTRNLIFDLDFIISDLSRNMTLLPGDIILTGTPAGVGMGFNPPKYLVPGDVVRCEIDQIGTLLNPIR